MGGHPRRLAVGVDVGGTKLTAAAVSSAGDVVVSPARADTPSQDGDAIVDLIVDLVARVDDSGALPVGVGAAGLLDRRGVVRYAPNLPWRDYPLAESLGERFSQPVIVDNDANAAAWGEFRVGAARQARTSAVMLTVGTGIGGGLILDERLVRGSGGFAGELGHLVIAEGGRRCSCGNEGCLEALASGTAIVQTAREWIATGRAGTDSALVSLADITGERVGQAARQGDPAALGVLAECGRWLGIGIAGIVNGLDPEIIVVGGGVAGLGDLLLEPAREALAERAVGHGYRSIPPVLAGALARDAGLVGAGLLALDNP